MYNAFQYNSFYYNQTPTQTTPEQGEIVYNGLNLQSDNIVVSAWNESNGPINRFNIYNNPRSNGGGVLSAFDGVKRITMIGYLIANDAEELNDLIDDFKGILGESEQNLDIKINGTIRRAKATWTNPDRFTFRQHHHITRLPFEIEFTLVEYQKELTRQIQSFLSQTANVVDEATNRASAIANPIVQVSVVSETDLTSIEFEANGTILTVDGSFSAGDLIKIDCEAKRVEVNSVRSSYSGQFPEFVRGANSYEVRFTDSGAYEVDVNVWYFKTYK